LKKRTKKLWSCISLARLSKTLWSMEDGVALIGARAEPA